MIRLIWPDRVMVLFVMCIWFLPLQVNAQSSSWNTWLMSQIKQHPDIIAARKQLSGANANADVLEQHIFNPELSAEIERDGNEENYSLGIQQTIDWWNQRGAKQQQASFQRAKAKTLYHQRLLEKKAEVLEALVEWHFANRLNIIAQKQQQQFNTLLGLVEKRQQAGDFGSIDAELTFLSLSKQLAQVVDVEIALQKSQTRVNELLPEWSPERGGVPDSFWPSKVDFITDQELMNHPTIASAHANWQSLKEEINVTRLAAKALPTIGVNARREEGENVVGLIFSIPLNIRNNYSDQIRVSQSKAFEAESRFNALFRKQRFEWKAAYYTWKLYQQQYLRWQTIAESRVENSASLLEKQWNSGDLSTTNYLLALNQRAESLFSGIELKKKMQQAFVEVLKRSSRLKT